MRLTYFWVLKQCQLEQRTALTIECSLRESCPAVKLDWPKEFRPSNCCFNTHCTAQTLNELRLLIAIGDTFTRIKFFSKFQDIWLAQPQAYRDPIINEQPQAALFATQSSRPANSYGKKNINPQSKRAGPIGELATKNKSKTCWQKWGKCDRVYYAWKPF